MDVKFEKPFEFQLEILETDDHIPSFRAGVRIVIEQLLQKFQYEGTLWIECVVWDSFMQGLRDLSTNSMPLHDMSENFMLSVQNTEQGLMLNWKLVKSDVYDKRQMTANFAAVIDEEALAIIRRAFDDFSIWW